MVMCELDDIIFNSTTIHTLKERFDEAAEEAENDEIIRDIGNV